MVNEHSETWVVVADGTKARIFSWSTANASLEEVDDLLNVEGRLHNSELASDKYGMAPDSSNQKSQHRMQQRNSPHEKSINAFALRVRDTLRTAYDEKRFRRCVLIAPAKFMGLLKARLPSRVAKSVSATLPLNLTSESPQAILDHLPD